MFLGYLILMELRSLIKIILNRERESMVVFVARLIDGQLFSFH